MNSSSGSDRSRNGATRASVTRPGMRRVVGWLAPAACVFILTACPITVDPPDNMPVWYSTISGYVSAPGTPGASGASAADSAALQVERPPSRPTPRGADYYAAQPRLSEDIVPGKLVVRLADPVFAASARALPVLSVGQRTPQMVAPAIGEGSFRSEERRVGTGGRRRG